MTNNKTKRHAWRVWLCTLLIAALTMMGVTAEETPEVEVHFDETSVGLTEGESVDAISGEDESEASIEMDDGAIDGEAPVDIDLALDGLDVPELLVDGLGSGDGVTEETAFAAESNSSKPEDFVIEDGVLVEYVGPGGDVVIPDGVTEIRGWGSHVENGDHVDDITSLVIPDSVTVIACDINGEKLTKVTIGKGLRQLGEDKVKNVFATCSSLKTVDISQDNRYFKSINGIVYDYNLKELLVFPACHNGITFPDGVERIGNDAFYRNNSITSLVIPRSVTSIGDSAFAFANLTDVTIENGDIIIEENAFDACNSLSKLTIGSANAGAKGTGSIDCEAFWCCEKLKDVTIGGGITSIGNWAFSHCKTLTNVVLLDGVTYIGREAFSSCEGLTSITIPESVTCIAPGAFGYITFGESDIEDYPEDSDVYKLKDKLVDVTIYGKTGSYAETYAKENSIPFVSIGTVTAKPTVKPTVAPTVAPTVKPTAAPTIAPTVKPTVPPTVAPTVAPTEAPTPEPTLEPTPEPPVEPAKITLNKKKATLVAGAKLALKASLTPKGAKSELTWTSSNKKVATVTQKGVVKALRKGTATITVRTANGKKATCKITVPTAPTKIAFVKKNYSVKVGKKIALKTSLTPAKAKTRLTWTSSNKKIATVSSKGVVKGIRKGKVVITVKTANGKKAKVKVTVN